MKYKSLIEKWAPVLESEIGESLDQHNQEIISQLLDNQVNFNKGNSSSFSQIDPSMETYQKYALPLIRRDIPKLLGMKLCDVSVSKNNTGVFYLKRNIDNVNTFVNGAVTLNKHSIRSHYSKELQQDLAALHGQDIEALMLDALSFEYTQYIDRELINKMKKLSNNIKLGGSNCREEDLSLGGMDGDEEYLVYRLLDRIVSDAIEINSLTKIGYGNFLICSRDMLIILLESPQFKLNTNYDKNTNISQTGILSTDFGEILVFIDNLSSSSYLLVGLHGKGQGESGIAFIPGIPYNITKTYDPATDNDKITINSSWRFVDEAVGSGHFYRYTEYFRVKEAVEKTKLIM